MLDRLLHFIGLERRNHRLSEWTPEQAALFGAPPTAAGAAVTPETAMRSPTFAACVRGIAETVGSLPLHLYRRQDDGGRDRERDHPAARLLSGDWAPWASGTDARTQMQTDALLHGTAFAQVLRTSDGRPVEIHRLDPRNVTPDWSGDEPAYKVRTANVERVLSWRDVLVIATPGSAPGRVLSVLSMAREAIGLDLVMGEHQGRMFSQGARPGGVLEVKSQLSAESVARLRESWQALYGGPAGAGRTAVLEEGTTFKPTQLSSVDSQFLELRKFTSQEIARVCRVPGTLVGDLERGTWRNVEELSRQFVTYGLLPWLEVWEGALARVLLTPAERESLYIEPIVEDLLRGDLSARFTAYRNAAGGAWLTPNEVRARENLPPVEGGDELIRQAGQIAAVEGDQTGEPAKLKAVA